MTVDTRKRSEPKGRPTSRRTPNRQGVLRANRNATLQWLAVFVVSALLIIGAGILVEPSGADEPTRQPVRTGGHPG